MMEPKDFSLKVTLKSGGKNLKVKKIKTAPATYKEFKKTCEEQFFINFKNGIQSVQYYDDDDCIGDIFNKDDYVNMFQLFEEVQTIKMTLISNQTDNGDDDSSQEEEDEKSAKIDDNSDKESDSEEKPKPKPKGKKVRVVPIPDGKPKLKKKPSKVEQPDPSLSVNPSQPIPSFDLSSLEKKLNEIDEKLTKINQYEELMNQIKSNQEKISKVVVDNHLSVVERINKLESSVMDLPVMKSLVDIQQKENENYANLTQIIKEMKDKINDIQSNPITQPKQSISNHQSNHVQQPLSNIPFANDNQFQPSYSFDILNKVIDTSLSGLVSVPLVIAFAGNTTLPKNYFISDANPDAGLVFEPVILNNDEWIPNTTKTINVQFKVIKQPIAEEISKIISFNSPTGSPVTMVTITLRIPDEPLMYPSFNPPQPQINNNQSSFNPPMNNPGFPQTQINNKSPINQYSTQFQQQPYNPQQQPVNPQPSQPIPQKEDVKENAPFTLSEEEMKTKIEELDNQFNVNSIFADTDIRDALIRAKGDINKAQEILFD